MMHEKTAKQEPTDIDGTVAMLNDAGYIAPRTLATTLFLALSMQKPLLLEGEAGVGKTALAQTTAKALQRKCIRLQCYEGLDAAAALYDWDYPRQLLAAQTADGANIALYDEKFLLKRPLLQALDEAVAPVLLIDELDRADEPFDAFLLEFLSDFSVSIPEFGRLSAKKPPLVFITSNRTREIHDAIRRRCLYHWVDFPDAERETAIIGRKAPQTGEHLSRQIVAFVQKLRNLDLFKPPGIAETLDWAAALAKLQSQSLDEKNIEATLGALLKYQDDYNKIREKNFLKESSD